MMNKILILIFLCNLLWINSYGINKEKPLIFPVPQEVQMNNGVFTIDRSTSIFLPEQKNDADDFLSRLLFK